MPGRVLALLIAVLLASFSFASCAAGPLVDHDEPYDYRLRFSDGSWLKGPARFHALIRLSGPDEIYVNLRATNGSMASTEARRWANELNRMRPGIAESSSNTLTIRRVLRIEIRTSIRGIKLTEIGPST